MDIKLLQLEMLTNLGDEIDLLIGNISEFNRNESKILQKQYYELDSEVELSDNDKWSIQENLIDLNEELKEVEELSYELGIIALYKKIEITTKRAIKIVYSDIDQKKLFKFKELKKSLKDKNIDLESIVNFHAMDELRCLNNSIKHSNMVNNELAKYEGWEENKELSGLKSVFVRLNPLCRQYLDDILHIFKLKYKELEENKLKESSIPCPNA